MKKTLVAIAAVIATTGAMAEVTISGAVDMALQSSNTDGTKTTSMFGVNNEFSNVAFRATDDIGGGLKSEAYIDLGLYSGAEAGGSQYTRELYVGLMGDFGSLHFGRKLDPLFLAFAANEVNGAPAGVGGNEGINSIVLVQGQRDARRDNSIMWQSPEMNGIKINAHWAAADTDGTATWGESSGWGVTYAAGALNANYQWQKTSLEGILDYTSTSTVGASVVDGSATRQVAALSYDLGAVKLAYTYANASNDSVTVNANYVGISMPMGAITLSASMYNNTHVDSSASTDVSGSGSLFRANYAMSKRTKVYAIYGSSTYDDATYVRRSIVGLTHSF